MRLIITINVSLLKVATKQPFQKSENVPHKTRTSQTDYPNIICTYSHYVIQGQPVYMGCPCCVGLGIEFVGAAAGKFEAGLLVQGAEVTDKFDGSVFLARVLPIMV